MIKELYEEAFSKFSDSYMTEDDRRISYSEFADLVSSYTTRIEKGECVLILPTASKIDSAAIILSCLFKGGIVILPPPLLFEGKENIQKCFPHSFLYDGSWKRVDKKESYHGRYPSEARVTILVLCSG